jgi:5-methylcytosine-specific restriction endonuclease McrA
VPLKPCLRCGRLTPSGSYCPLHEPRHHPSGFRLRPSPSSRSRPSGKLRRTVLARDKRCVHCGSTVNLRLHHVLPVSRGGEHSEANVVTLCRACHRAAHSK